MIAPLLLAATLTCASLDQIQSFVQRTALALPASEHAPERDRLLKAWIDAQARCAAVPDPKLVAQAMAQELDAVQPADKTHRSAAPHR